MPRIRSAGVILPPSTAAPANRPDPGQASVQFEYLLEGAYQAAFRERLEEQLNAIEHWGTLLAEECSVEHLKAYRAAIHRFLSEAQRAAVSVRSELGWDHQTWERHSMTTIRKIDQNLEALAQEMVAREENRIRLLVLMGEIRGLLLDLRL